MAKNVDRAGWPGPEYHIRTVFQAPVDYSFAWCTDYTSLDSKLEGENYFRKILRRGRRRVVYEDLSEEADGWAWARSDVTLRPPDRWHAVAVGNRVQTVADYQLTELPRGRTRLDIWWRRRPSLMRFKKRVKAEAEKSGALGWRRFARALNADFRESRK